MNASELLKEMGVEGFGCFVFFFVFINSLTFFMCSLFYYYSC